MLSPLNAIHELLFFLLLRVLASHHLVVVLVAPEMPGLSGSLGLDA